MWDIIVNNGEAVAGLVFTAIFAFTAILFIGPLDKPKPFSLPYFCYLFGKVFGYLFAAAPLVFLIYVLSTGEGVDQLQEVSGLFFLTLLGSAFLFGAIDFMTGGEKHFTLVLLMVFGLLMIFPAAAYLYQNWFESSVYTSFKAFAIHFFNLFLYPMVNLTVGIVFTILGFQYWNASRQARVSYYYPSAVLAWLIAVFIFFLPGAVAFLNYTFSPDTVGQTAEHILLIQKQFNNVLEIFKRYWEGILILVALGPVLTYFKRDQLMRRPLDSIKLFFLLGYVVFLLALGQFLYSVTMDFQVLLTVWE